MKIEELTSLQQNQLIKCREEFLKWGLCCEPANKELAIKSITKMYSLIRKKTPYFWFCDSPLMIQLVMYIIKHVKIEKGDNLWDNLGDNLGANLRDNLWDSDFWGQMDLYWICYYTYPQLYLNIHYDDAYNTILDLWDKIGHSINWWYPYENICFISDRPKEIHKKGIVLHNEKGSALSFRDGYSLWFLNGVDVGKEIVETPAEKLNPELLITEKNAQIRREIIRKIGANKLLQKLNAKKLDCWREYELYRLENIDIEPVHILKMSCPSTEIIYSLRVPPEITKAYEATTWCNNNHKPDEFMIET